MFSLNLPSIERVIRALVGLAMATCGWVCSDQPNVLFIAIGTCVALTGLIGFCPACALVGRRLKSGT